MKTPQEIADEITPQIPGLNAAFMRTMSTWVVAAIEADRTQKRIDPLDLDEMLAAWEDYDGDVSGFLEEWAGHFNEGTDVPDWAQLNQETKEMNR